MKKLVLLFIFISPTAFAQQQRSAHWYFGFRCGLDFTSGTAVADTTGMLESIEGSASISDLAGNLLFYSSGEKVWDKNHVLMPNGNGMLGNQSSVQSSLIIPEPGSSSRFYIFTTCPINHFRYSIVDMTLNGGNGDVTATKNMLLNTNATEMMAATYQCNAQDHWIMTTRHSGGSIDFFAYPLTGAGVGSPVISTYTWTGAWPAQVGSLTFSQKGDKLCFNDSHANTILFDFDNEAGTLTPTDTIFALTNELVYANAFSGKATKLYLSRWTTGSAGHCYVSQYDLTAPDINASRVDLDSVYFALGSPNGYGFIGELRLGPDQKIYVSRWNQDYPYVVNPLTYYSLDSIDVINDPDSVGFACNFQRNAIYLDHRPTMLGLPGFHNTFTSPVVPVANCKQPDAIAENIKEHQVQIFPNPFTQQTTLQLNVPLQNATITLQNQMGQTVNALKNQQGSAILIERNNLPAGIYTVIISENNHVGYVTQKLVIVD